MATYRLTSSFISGEISPLLEGKTDFARYKNSCNILKNMIALPQGPATRRPGFRFIYDMANVGMSMQNPQIRLIPFIFNELQAYSLIFYKHVDARIHVVFGDQNGLIAYPDPAPTECPPGTPVTDTPGAVVQLTLPPEWDIENFDYAQSGDELFITQSTLSPKILTRWGPYCWELTTPGITDQPDDWSDANGWPEKVTFHQQRLAFAANNTRRQTVWLSKAGSFLDFGFSNPLVDSDAVTFTLDSGTQNKIVWMVSHKSLNLGTLGNEWTVVGSTRAALTPTNILAEQQTHRGSAQNKPLLVGDAVVYLERHGRVLNEFLYDFTNEGFSNNDISILATHLTDPAPIKHWTYQQSPTSILWFVREDGVLLGLTYQRLQKVVAWHQHESKGDFLAITSVPGDNREDEVWVAVTRVANGNLSVYIEKLERQFVNNTEDLSARFVDCFVDYEGEPINVMSGLDHLEGAEVVAFVDGAAHPPMTVEGGQVNLNGYYSTVAVGVPYASVVSPNLMQAALQSGATNYRNQRILSLSFDFYRTVGGSFGDVPGQYIEEIPFRVPGDLTGTAVPLYTGVVEMNFPEGYSFDSKYYVQQTQPLPMTVRAVVDLVDLHD